MMQYSIQVVVVLALPPFTNAVNYPIGITNCGVQSWIDKPPQRAVTMNQGTTEIMLALNLSDRMVGTAYLDDEIWSELAEDYAKVPVLSKEYPDVDTLMAAEPDFVYASYMSAFANGSSIHYSKHLGECDLVGELESEYGPNQTYCRQELHDRGIQTYLQGPYCELVEHRPADNTAVQVLYDEIWDIATIFDVPDQARALIDSIENHFEQASRVTAKSDTGIPPIKILWLDSWDDETPFVGACCGSVNLIIDSAGAKNIFEDLGVEEKVTWKSAAWDEVEKLDPDLIVLVDASWDMADEKIFKLCNNSKTRALRSVKNRAFITVPFSGSTLGVRIGSLAYNLAEAMLALTGGKALPALQFSQVSITKDGDAGSQAVSPSGVRVYTQLPTWNGTNLEEFCPGSSIEIQIRDDLPAPVMESSNSSSITAEWIAVIVVLAVVVIGVAGFLGYVISKEKQGKPLFVDPDDAPPKHVNQAINC